MKLFMTLALLAAALPLRAQTFSVGSEQFLLNGRPFQIIAGEMHYARIPREYWRDRLLKARAMGLNTVATYVFWNVHEPSPDRFNFEGMADVAAFVREAQAAGLWVILRPGPYACAEWEFGGFPAWLLRDSTMRVRSADPKFLERSRRYIERLGRELAPLQITQGGPIIMVQVENEYGSFGNDTLYEGKIRDMLVGAGFEVPLFTADGPSQMPNAYLPGILPGVNGATGEDILAAIRRYRPTGPFFVPEFYPGWLDHWGEPHAQVDMKESSQQLDWMLSHDVSVSLYMFHGGTNFGFMNGANYGGHFQPQPTSYDYDAPLDEAGGLTPKYFAFRDVIRKHLPDSVVIPEPPPTTNAAIAIPRFTLRELAGLSDLLTTPVRSARPLSMEELGQAYGYLLYRTTINDTGLLSVKGLRDYATVLLNGKQVASLDRRNKQAQARITRHYIPAVLDLLVENGGRINYGRELLDNRKGIISDVTLGGKVLVGWEQYSLPMDTVPPIPRAPGQSEPLLFGASVTLDRVGDTYLDMRGWGKGCVWVNGHSLGRFWYIGPQQTLYLPGAWLRPGENRFVVLDLEDQAFRTIEGVPKAVLNELQTDRLKPILPRRHPGRVKLERDDLAAEGSFTTSDLPQDVAMAPRMGRYLCLESRSSQRSDPFASVSELELLDPDGKPLPRTYWFLVTVDSEELTAEDGHAENAFDGDPETIWHTQWGASKPDHPHVIVIDAGQAERIAGFRYRSRTGDAPGKIKEFRFYVRNTPFEFNK